MTDETYKIGDQVEIRLTEKFGEFEGWYPGTVVRIEPYSQHRNFYWVRLADGAKSLLQMQEISVFNPKNIRKLSAE